MYDLFFLLPPLPPPPFSLLHPKASVMLEVNLQVSNNTGILNNSLIQQLLRRQNTGLENCLQNNLFILLN